MRHFFMPAVFAVLPALQQEPASPGVPEVAGASTFRQPGSPSRPASPPESPAAARDDTQNPRPIEYFVAPNGADRNSGTSDAPFATLSAARDALRAARSRPEHVPRPVTVWLRAGCYRIAEPLLFEAQDSGTQDFPVVYQAWAGEAVTLTGGVTVPNAALLPVDDARLLSRIISPEARTRVRRLDLRTLGISTLDPVLPRGFTRPIRPAPPELFVNGRPMPIARWPNDGFVKTGPTSGPGAQPTDKGGQGHQPVFQFADQRLSLWSSAPDMWLMGYWKYDWAEESIPVASLDIQTRQITLATPHVYGIDADKPFYAENLLEEIDQPCEYYIDREADSLYFWPPDDAGPDSLLQLSVTSAPLVSCADASWITLRGLHLSVARGDGARVSRGRGIRFEGCTFNDLGNRAVVIEGGSEHAVADCDIFDAGEGGIQLSGGDRTTLTPSGHVAEGNDIYRFNRRGRTYRPAIGMTGVGCRAAHNLIHDAPHSAIIFGGNDHVIEYNEIHHVLQLTGDGGAVYIGRDWTFRGNIIRYNYFHDLRGVGLWENAVYIDDQASGMTISSNVFQNCHWGMLIGGGRDNIIENNMFSSCDLALQLDARGLGWGKDQLGPTLRKNLTAVPYKGELWSSKYPALANIDTDDPMTPKRNILRNNILLRSGAIDARMEPAARQNALLEDNVSTQEDPGFVDPAHGDFALRAGAALPSPAPGFHPIPNSLFGPQRLRPGAAASPGK